MLREPLYSYADEAGELTLGISSLYLRNFRCHREAFFSFSPGINCIIGPNARGKTSLLEAIYVLLCGRSLRSHDLKEAIFRGEEAFLVEANFSKLSIPQTLSFWQQRDKRILACNKNTLPSLNSLIGLIPGVLLQPQDLQLLQGPPQGRRQFLDLQLSQGDPLYLHHLCRYSHALAQRNRLLKRKEIRSISAWESLLSQSGQYLQQAREELIEQLQPFLRSYYQKISGEEAPLQLEYCPSPLKDSWEKYRPREEALGYTLWGPHRDDWRISLHHLEAPLFASEGQMRSIVAALRLAQWQRLSARTELLPLVLMDDLGQSLDRQRRERFTAELSSFGQVFLTSTEPDLLHNQSSHASFLL